MVFLKIGSQDVTSYCDIQNFDINKNAVYTSWTDGNKVEHREIVRTRIEGTVKVGFRYQEDLQRFYNALSASLQPGGYYSVTAYIQNTAETVTFNAFIETSAESKFDLLNRRFWKAIELEIKER